MSTPKVLIVGAGIGGLTAAIALRARGINVEVYEAAPQLPASGTGLGLASNATKVLHALGIDLGLEDCGCALERLELRTARGKMIRALPIQSITAELGDPIISIHRSDLMRVLLDAAGDTPIRFRAQIVDFETGDQGVRAMCADGLRSAGRRTDRCRRHPVDNPVKDRGCGVTYRLRVRILACHSRFRASTCRSRICRPLLGEGTAVRVDRHRWGKGLLVGK